DNPVEAASLLANLGAALRALEAVEKVPGVLAVSDHPTASLLQTFLAQRASDPADAGTLEPSADGNFLEAKFDEKDLRGWIGSFFRWIKGIKKHTWIQPPAAPEAFDDISRIALLGDWGTGLYGAPVCASSIESEPSGYQVAIHLGDVYYAGDKDEINDRFLA